MRLATPDELAAWNQLIARNPDGGSNFQIKALGDTKDKHGWQTRRYIADGVAIQLLVRKIPLLGEFWYIPEGPGVADAKGLKSVIKALQALSDPSPFVVRLDPLISKSAITAKQLGSMGLQKSRDIQYNISTIIVNLSPSENDILASFKQKTRYNVRLAAKKGVTCAPVETNDENIAVFYDLAVETYTRAGVYVRSKQYFSDFWRAHVDQGAGQMFFAHYDGQVVGAVFATYVGHKALYKDGASSREHSGTQAMAGLQWEVMQWLKAHGVTEYDLDGVPPADRIDDQTHPLAGLARFKTGFNPEVTEYIGTYDLALKPRHYQMWLRFGERLAMSYEFRARKRLFY